MDVKKNSKIISKGIFRVSVSILVSIIAAKIVFILIAAFTFLPAISESSFFSGVFISIGIIAGLFSGIFCFIKLNTYLKGEMQKT